MDSVCDWFDVWYVGLMPGNSMCSGACHVSWHILPSGGIISLALPLAWALGLQMIHRGQGQPLCLLASGVGQVLGCDWQ